MINSKSSSALVATCLAASILLGASCGVRLKSSGGGNQSATPGGGVYKSQDQGKTWQQVVFVSRNERRTVTIAGLSLQRIVISPVDPNHVYALAGGGGLYETRDGGSTWKQLFDGPVQGFAPHSANREVLYLASGSKILRTANGGQDWQTVYIEPTPKVLITDLDLVAANPKTVYALTNSGVVLRSDSEGTTWRKTYFFKQTAVRLYVNQRAERVVYIALPTGSLWRSGDGGDTWTDASLGIREQLKVPVRPFRALAFLPGHSDAVLYANQQGLYRSPDGGVTWEEVKIVTAPAAISITALAVNPKRAEDIYYATAAAFYHSANGGGTWSTLPLPTQLLPGALAAHPADGKTIYLGFTR